MQAQQLILLVEDNEDDVILAQRAFRKAGVDVPICVVRDGDEAVDYLGGGGRYGDRRSFPLPTIVLLDLKLPRRSGLDVLRWIRADPALGTLPVIVFTTSAQASDLEQAYSLGANSYLKKPVTLEDTTEMLRAAGLYWLTHNEAPPQVRRGF
ncbi:Response regulator receiver domain-containing protein [Noviherbaspirillum humi]|uniref:Response regulator receiver domain-containing protein n=1 Tax=Noviherbaspirillum humi TaxID=1688639 RepID=A0A239FPM8_9BURK|nr:response regulator [Noviherbaspirillum humi]SNS57874.1 Response regulator receiver domain-containing protein [Noviherbaspirillum humi]